MTKKKTAGRGAGSGRGKNAPGTTDVTGTTASGSTNPEDYVGEVAPSPVAKNRLDRRLHGGVTQVGGPQSPAEKALAVRAADEMVEVPRLDFTIKYRGVKYYPSSQPVKIPYGAALTHGLLGVEKAEGDLPPAVRNPEVLTEPNSEGGTPAEDNGTGGTGAPIGTELPASSLADQAPTTAEIEEAAEAAGRSTEQVAELRQREIDQRLAAREESGFGVRGA